MTPKQRRAFYPASFYFCTLSTPQLICRHPAPVVKFFPWEPLANPLGAFPLICSSARVVPLLLPPHLGPPIARASESMNSCRSLSLLDYCAPTGPVSRPGGGHLLLFNGPVLFFSFHWPGTAFFKRSCQCSSAPPPYYDRLPSFRPSRPFLKILFLPVCVLRLRLQDSIYVGCWSDLPGPCFPLFRSF